MQTPQNPATLPTGRAGIYGLRSLALGRLVYIGSTANLGRRQRQHRHNQAQTRPHNGKSLQKHVCTYGANDLQFDILLLCDTSQLTTREGEFIALHRTHRSYGGCNVRIDPASNIGISTGVTPWNKGRTMDEAYRLRVSVTTKRAMANPAVRQRISAAKKGKPSSRLGVRTGKTAPNARPVDVVRHNGETVGQYESVEAAADALSMKMQTVWAAARFGYRTRAGYLIHFIDKLNTSV